MKFDFNWPKAVFKNIPKNIEPLIEKKVSENQNQYISKNNTIETIQSNKNEIETKQEKSSKPKFEQKDSLKEEKLTALKEQLIAFEKTPNLFLNYSENLVFSDGNYNSKLMFIGEAPGEEEDKELKPFVGRSGKLLSKFLEELELDRTKYYIVNTVPWRPPNNRTPTLSEINLLKPFLLEHIKIVEPTLIVAIGSVAAKVLEIDTAITNAQGKMFVNNIGNIFCIYHPSYILRLAYKKKDFWLSLIAMKEQFEKLNNKN